MLTEFDIQKIKFLVNYLLIVDLKLFTLGLINIFYAQRYFH